MSQPERVRFGEEMERAYPLVRELMLRQGQGAATYDWRGLERCPECQVARGELHEEGCDLEKCPRCGWQAIACWCEQERP